MDGKFVWDLQRLLAARNEKEKHFRIPHMCTTALEEILRFNRENSLYEFE